MDAGILPLRALLASFGTVRRESLPTSARISMESLLLMRSRRRREGSAVTQVGISPAMSFQSAMMRVRKKGGKFYKSFNPVVLLTLFPVHRPFFHSH
ncbi:hypothetical protein D0Y65_033884 [Glycine soja]|uniref:Uncharacterized protein n=1 Tax=Glycine soja TaxID=3848 RepID=A0A445HNJ8_GLYSO|nr:hypothetical protein D0Y65_033884 [Glycine soja]